MKVLILNGSPRSGGNTSIALREMEQIFHGEGVETELVQAGNLDIRGCIACDSASNSESVEPIHAGGQIVRVLDMDSPHIGRFAEADRTGLEEFVRILEAEVWGE